MNIAVRIRRSCCTRLLAGLALLAPALAAAQSISGTVYEDVRYPGGAGRDWATALASGGAVRSGARVELYNASGNFAAATTTDASGAYIFSPLFAGTYTVRVVNGSVTGRSGYNAGTMIPVQTYRTDASSGTAVAVTNHVGGENPALNDAGNGSTTLAALSVPNATTAQSVTTVNVSSSNVPNVDFGFSFSTVVNIRDSTSARQQGTLRQVLINLAGLTAAGVSFTDLTGRAFTNTNVTIFMIPDGSTRPGLNPNFDFFTAADCGRKVASIAAVTTFGNGATRLDAQTHPAFDAVSPMPLVELNGSGTAPGTVGVSAGGTAGVTGFIINRFPSHGIQTSGTGVRVEGSWVGLHCSGNAAAANGGSGVVISAGGNHQVGMRTGNAARYRMVISGNAQHGINGNSGGLTGTLRSNYIGTNWDGSAAVPNGGNGIDWTGSNVSIVSGGTSFPQVVSGNTGWGIRMSNANGAGGATISDLTIGRNAVNSANVPNGAGGIWIENTASMYPITGNRIGGNNGDGLRVSTTGVSTAAVRARMNSFFDNAGLGINLVAAGDPASGVTANSGALAATTTPNRLMNHPVITSATLSGSSVAVAGYVGSAANQSAFAFARVEIFVAAPDPTGYGEGRTYVGFLFADANGNFSGIPDPSGATVPVATVVSGDALTATAEQCSSTTTCNGLVSEFGPLLSVSGSQKISGVVFEDANYGGGVGRNRATALTTGGSGRSGATVELYDASGMFVRSATSGAGGAFEFTGVAPGSYSVRVVSSTVTSARTGYVNGLLPVQTYRVDATTGALTDVLNRVGGENPALPDAAAGSAGTTLAALNTPGTAVHSLAPVTVGASDVANVDFGFCFNVIVNVRDSGQGSLRQFLLNANALSNAGLAIDGRTAGIDHAIFMLGNGSNSPGLNSSINVFSGGVATIAPSSALPVVTDPLVLDAQTQPGWLGAPVVQLSGGGAGSTAALAFATTGSTVRGFIIGSFSGDGIQFNGGSGHTAQGNWIGLSASGTAAATNTGSGIVLSGASSSLVGGTASSQRNVIGGNGGSGIQLAAASGILIQGNYVGTNASGAAAIANGTHGVRIDGGGSHSVGGEATGAGNTVAGNTGHGIAIFSGTNNVIAGNRVGVAATTSTAIANTQHGIYLAGSGHLVGGSTAAARNVIAGNAGDGLQIAAGSNISVRANYIGVDPSGAAALANGGNGIQITGTSAGNAIGGASAGERNVISGNGVAGIRLAGSNVSATAILGNYIGTDASGSTAARTGPASGIDGVYIWQARNTVIGVPGAGNLISGNPSCGIYLGDRTATGTLIQGNRIGESASGTALANGGCGVYVDADQTTIGGAGSGEGNVIRATGGTYPGVFVRGFSGSSTSNDAQRVRISGNSIYGNGGLGIDLGVGGAFGVTANDGAKNTAQPNSGMDSPVFTSASYNGSVLRVRGYVGTQAGQSLFGGATVEVFVADGDSSGYGEGRTYLGTLPADANGNFSGQITTAAIAVSGTLTGTATDASGNTSEFGPNAVVRDYRPFRNGSFEEGDLGAKVNVGDGFIWNLAGGSTALDYWVVGGGIQAMGSDYWNASDGVRSVELNLAGSAGGSVEQTFDTDPGVTYSVYFDYSGSAACGPTRKSLRVSAAGASQDVANYLIGGSAVIPAATGGGSFGVYYQTGLFQFTAASDLTTLRFESINDTVCGPIIDNVRVDVARPFTNGSFETGPAPGSYLTLSAGDASISGWRVANATIDYIGGYWNAADGARSIDLEGNPGSMGAIEQTFDLVPDQYYRARFAMSANPDGGPATKTLVATAGADAASFNSTSNSRPLAWTDNAFTFLATGGATTLRFGSINATAYGPTLDNVRIEDAQPFVNGSFENFRFPARSATNLTADTILMRGWVTAGASLQHWGSATLAPSAGNYSLHLNGPAGAGSVSQTFEVEPGQSYDLLYDVAPSPGSSAPQLRASITGAAGTLASRDVTADASGWRTRMLSFTPTTNRVTVTFTSLTAGSLGAVIDNVRFGVAGGFNTVGSFNAFDTATPAGSVTGNIRTKVAGQAFTVDIAALDLDRAAYSTFPLTGIRVELLDAGNDSGTLDARSGCRTSWTPLATLTTTFAFAGGDNGRKPFTLAVDGAYRQLRLRMSWPASSPTQTGCSTDAFAARPAAFADVRGTDSDADNAGTVRSLDNTSATSGVVHKAGRAFSLQGRAVTASGVTATAYDGTPQLSITCIQPAGCSVGALAGTPTVSAGVLGGALTYGEAGVIGLQVEDTTFADVDALDGSTLDERAIRLAAPATIGRFVPDRYVVTPNAPTFAAACGAGNLSFVGQPFAFDTLPSAAAIPVSASGQTLNNARPRFTASMVVVDVTAVGAPVALQGTLGSISVASTNAAVVSVTGGQFNFARGGTPVAPFAPAFTLRVRVNDSTETNGGSPLMLSGEGSANFGFAAGHLVHYGRLNLRPAYGDARQDLVLPLEVHSYNGSGWLPLTSATACVAVGPGQFAYTDARGSLATNGLFNCASRVASVDTAAGRWTLRLPRPPLANGVAEGSMTVLTNTLASAAGQVCNASNLPVTATSTLASPWLAQPDGSNPAARAQWGRSRGEFVQMRERFN